MPRFSQTSIRKLDTCHQDLRILFSEVIKCFDCTILCGHREEEAQNEAFHTGQSEKEFPDSKHNKRPSIAVDAVPYPINWQDKERFYYFAGFVKGIASKLNIKIRWGGDWDNDTDLNDQTFFDLGHFELY